ncbi:MAG: hypothetical protein EZS28_043426, partial [Streblomastix strix]
KAFFVLTHPCSDKLRLLLCTGNLFTSLSRLFEHKETEIIDDAVTSIHNIVAAGINTTPDDEQHPFFDIASQSNGIEKMFALFTRATNKRIKDRSAVCIGQLFRSKEINDQKMKVELIGYLKSMTKDANEKIRNNAGCALNHLAYSQGNRTEIEKDGYIVSEVKKKQ